MLACVLDEIVNRKIVNRARSGGVGTEVESCETESSGHDA